MRWKKVKLESVTSSITDGDHQSIPLADTGIPFVVISDIKDNRISFDNVRYVSHDYYNSVDEKRRPKMGDVLLTVKGSFGIPAYVTEDKPFVFQRDVAIFKCNDRVNSRYLFYTFLNPSFYAYADLVAIGSAQRALTLKTLRNTEISLPPMEIQNKIVRYLEPLDRLIENNQKQIKLLEEAAQRLYKEWFVDLHFPGYEDVQITDGIPEDWERRTVGSLIGKIARTAQIMASDYMDSGAIPIIDQSKSFIAGYTDDMSALVDIGSPVIVFGDHTRILKYVQFPFAKGADGTQLIVTNNDKTMPQTLLYCSLVNVDLSNYHYARHFKYLKAEEILVPSERVAHIFDEITGCFFTRIQKLRDENRLLIEARDLMLPKLMSGEIEL